MSYQFAPKEGICSVESVFHQVVIKSFLSAMCPFATCSLALNSSVCGYRTALTSSAVTQAGFLAPEAINP